MYGTHRDQATFRNEKEKAKQEKNGDNREKRAENRKIFWLFEKQFAAPRRTRSRFRNQTMTTTVAMIEFELLWNLQFFCAYANAHAVWSLTNIHKSFFLSFFLVHFDFVFFSNRWKKRSISFSVQNAGMPKKHRNAHRERERHNGQLGNGWQTLSENGHFIACSKRLWSATRHRKFDAKYL